MGIKSGLRLLPGSGSVSKSHHPDVSKTRLDEEIIEDADTRHEQFTEEADRWRDDRPDHRE